VFANKNLQPKHGLIGRGDTFCASSLACISFISLQFTLGFLWSREQVHNAKMDWSTLVEWATEGILLS
jgi:hypothetical protein